MKSFDILDKDRVAIVRIGAEDIIEACMVAEQDFPEACMVRNGPFTTYVNGYRPKKRKK